MSTVSALSRAHRVRQAADTSNPGAELGGPEKITGADGSAIDATTATRVNFYIILEATGAGSVTLQPLHWDAATNRWHADPDQAKTFAAAGAYIWPVNSYGAPMFMKVTAISGTAAKASIRYGISRTSYR